MNVELIKIDPTVARAKLVEYRKAIARKHHSKAAATAAVEYEKIAAGYEAAAKGLPLIELSKAMAMGGWDELGRPKFAVHRADRRRVRCNAYRDGSLRFDDPSRSSALDTWRFERVMPPRPAVEPVYGAWAIVPLVPPDVLPRANLDLSKRVILWEADWQAAPVDPMLLLPIGGDLYAVEATWDLTPLERAVIEGRRS